MEMKNKPRPTGLPQLNHEPHARQFFMLSLWCCSYHSMLALSSIFSDIYVASCLLCIKNQHDQPSLLATLRRRPHSLSVVRFNRVVARWIYINFIVACLKNLAPAPYNVPDKIVKYTPIITPGTSTLFFFRLIGYGIRSLGHRVRTLLLRSKTAACTKNDRWPIHLECTTLRI